MYKVLMWHLKTEARLTRFHLAHGKKVNLRHSILYDKKALIASIHSLIMQKLVSLNFFKQPWLCDIFCNLAQQNFLLFYWYTCFIYLYLKEVVCRHSWSHIEHFEIKLKKQPIGSLSGLNHGRFNQLKRTDVF